MYFLALCEVTAIDVGAEKIPVHQEEGLLVWLGLMALSTIIGYIMSKPFNAYKWYVIVEFANNIFKLGRAHLFAYS